MALEAKTSGEIIGNRKLTTEELAEAEGIAQRVREFMELRMGPYLRSKPSPKRYNPLAGRWGGVEPYRNPSS